MTGASGKKNRMFVTKNTFKFSRWLMFCIIISAFALHAPGSWADDSNAFAKKKEAYKLPDADQQKELQQLLSNLAAKPDDQEIIVELDELLGDVLRQAESLIDAGAINQAGQMLSLIESINPELDGLAAAEKRLRSFTQTKELLIAGNAALAAQRMLEPENSSALHYFSQALANDPGNRLAQQGLSRVQGILVEQARPVAMRYRSLGLHIKRQTNHHGWSTLVLERAGPARPRKAAFNLYVPEDD